MPDPSLDRVGSDRVFLDGSGRVYRVGWPIIRSTVVWLPQATGLVPPPATANYGALRCPQPGTVTCGQLPCLQDRAGATNGNGDFASGNPRSGISVGDSGEGDLTRPLLVERDRPQDMQGSWPYATTKTLTQMVSVDCTR